MENVEVTDAMVDQLQQMQTVDIITLLPPLANGDYGMLHWAKSFLARFQPVQLVTLKAQAVNQPTQ